MPDIKASILETIGRTPIVRINRIPNPAFIPAGTTIEVPNA